MNFGGMPRALSGCPWMASLNLFKAFPNELLQTEVRSATMLPLRKTYASAVKRDAVFFKAWNIGASN